jgi:hypothetical protein
LRFHIESQLLPHSIPGIVVPPHTHILRSSKTGDIFIEGDSAEAAVLAIKHADCLILSPRSPEQMYADALPILHLGKQVGVHAPFDADVVAAYEQKGLSHFIISEPHGETF